MWFDLTSWDIIWPPPKLILNDFFEIIWIMTSLLGVAVWRGLRVKGSPLWRGLRREGARNTGGIGRPLRSARSRAGEARQEELWGARGPQSPSLARPALSLRLRDPCVCWGASPLGRGEGVKGRACTQRSRLHPRRDPHRPLRQLQLWAPDLRDPGLVPGRGGHSGDVRTRAQSAPLGPPDPSSPGAGKGPLTESPPAPLSLRPRDTTATWPSGGAPREVGGPSSWFRLLPPELRAPALAHPQACHDGSRELHYFHQEQHPFPPLQLREVSPQSR